MAPIGLQAVICRLCSEVLSSLVRVTCISRLAGGQILPFLTKNFKGIKMNAISDTELQQIRTQMLKFAMLQLHHADLAEDLVQEAFLSAFNNLANFKHQAAFKTWVFAILKNKIIDYLRQKGRFVLESEIEDEESTNRFFDDTGHWKIEYYPSELQGEEETVYSDEFWLIFETCLTCLPAKHAKIFMMREFLELSSDEICQETQLTTSNLHTTLYRARLQLQNCLSKKL